MPRVELVEAAKAGNLANVKALLRSGAPIEARDDDGLAPLHHAARCGHLGVVKELLCHGAQVNAPVFTPRSVAQGRTPAIEAASHGQLATLRCLVEHSAVLHDPGSVGIDAVMAAATGGNVAVMQYLVEEKELPCDEIGKDGVTPLYKAVEKADLSMVRYLLERGANPDKPGRGAHPPVEYARQCLRWGRLADAQKANLQGILDAMQRRPVSRPAPATVPGPSDAGDAYVARCMKKQYEEAPESRSWNSDPVFETILDPLNSGDNARACNAAQLVTVTYPDFALAYYWWGKALMQMGSLDKARQVLRTGLERAREKNPLCARLGEVEWKARALNSAVYWWVQAVHCQESLSGSNYGGSEDTYLYLHYVAEGRGLSECSRAYLQRVDSIRPGMIRLNAGTASDLIGLARSAGTRSVAQVLQALVERYIIPRRTSAPTAEEEVSRLIRQLEEVARSSRWEEGRDINAINRLAELGDQRAIDVLTRLAPLGGAFGAEGWIEVGTVAKKAVERIKAANR